MSGSSNTVSVERPPVAEEIFSTLFFPGFDFAFAISREELEDDNWYYRIYEPKKEPVKNKRIDQNEYNRIREMLMKGAELCNSGNQIAAHSHINRIAKVWMQHWGEDSVTSKG